MSTTNGSKLWKWAVVLLVICNVGLMLTIWLKPRMPFGSPPSEGPRNFVIQRLKFSDEQVKKYDALINVHKHTMDSLRGESMRYRQQLFANLKNEAAGGVDADSLAKRIGDNQKQIEMATYNHFVQVRAICTDAQKTELDKIIGEVTKKMNSNPRSGPPPHGDHPRGPQDDGNPPPPPPQDRPGPPEN